MAESAHKHEVEQFQDADKADSQSPDRGDLQTFHGCQEVFDAISNNYFVADARPIFTVDV